MQTNIILNVIFKEMKNNPKVLLNKTHKEKAT